MGACYMQGRAYLYLRIFSFFFEASHLGTAVVSCTFTNARPRYPHTHHTHTTRAQLGLQLHRDRKTASFLRSLGPTGLHRWPVRCNPIVAPHERGCRWRQWIKPRGEAPWVNSRNRTQDLPLVQPRASQPSYARSSKDIQLNTHYLSKKFYTYCVYMYMNKKKNRAKIMG
jgi:hypothetical protein